MPSLTARKRDAELLRTRARASLARGVPAPPPAPPPPPTPCRPLSACPQVTVTTINVDAPTPLSDQQSVTPPAADAVPEPEHVQPRKHRPHRRNPKLVLTVTRANGTLRKSAHAHKCPARLRYEIRRREKWIDIVASLFALSQDGAYDEASRFAEVNRDVIHESFFKKRTKQEVVEMLTGQFVQAGDIAAE